MTIENFDPTSFLKSSLITILSFLSPIWGLALLVGFAVISDTAYAIYAVVSKKGWKAYKASILFDIAPKTFFYMGSLLFAFLIDKFIIDTNVILGVDLLVSKTIAVLWTYIEVKSIDETSKKLGNRSMYVVIKELIKNAKSIKKDVDEIKE
jgi:hypothetical protein